VNRMYIEATFSRFLYFLMEHHWRASHLLLTFHQPPIRLDRLIFFLSETVDSSKAESYPAGESHYGSAAWECSILTRFACSVGFS
jgi:hypothetical protein